jgi:homoserine dehydrogenase
MRTINVAVAGLGFVGSEAVRLLLSNKKKFATRLGANLVVAAVCDRQVKAEAKKLGLGPGVFLTKDPRELADLSGIDIVVETMGGLDAPRALVLSALKARKHVVTANKRLLSHSWNEIQRAVASSGARLYFEGSVAGGIPIIQALDNGLAANSIEGLYGILNGTTNYILSNSEKGADPKEVLKDAQRLGLAEKDPTLDLNGTDTLHKVSVLASLITGARVPAEDILREGIESVEAEDMAFAREELGRTIRLLGALKFSWPKAEDAPVGVEAHVFPTLVPLGHPLAAVHGEYNALLVKASSAGDLMFYGKGAGPGPAASAVVGDVVMLARDILGSAPPKKAAARKAVLLPLKDSVSSFYLRLHVDEKPGVLAAITKALSARRISIASIHQSDVPQTHGIPVVITTHPTRQGDFTAALKSILALKTVSARHTVLRLLS